MKDLKVIFMGTPEFAVPVLDMLIKETNVIMVVTQPDKEVGRHHILTPSPIKELATKNNIPVFQPSKIRNEYDEIIKMQPDIIITCAYGQIIPKEILECPELGCINVHASLLPKLRGGAPIHHAIIDNYSKTGITIMYMDEKMDTGDIISTSECIIKDDDNVGTLHDKLSTMGAELLKETLPSIVNKTNVRIKQNNEEATYAWNISREDEHLDFNSSAKDIYNRVRGLNPWPLANAIILDQEVKIIDCFISEKVSLFSPGTISDITKDYIAICTKDNIICVTKLKPFGKSAMLTKDYINGIKKEKLINTIVE